MLPTRLRYALQDGYIHHWLVMGPYPLPVGGGESSTLEPDPVVADDAAEPTSPDDVLVLPGDQEGRWRYVRSLDDHTLGDLRLMPLSGRADAADVACVWAYAELESPSTREVTLVVTLLGLGAAEGDGASVAGVNLWVNRQHVGPQPTHTERRRRQLDLSYGVQLAQGTTSVLVRITMPLDRVAATSLALRVVHPDPDVRHLPADVVGVCLPTRISPLERRDLLERVFCAAYLDRYVFAREDELLVHWPEKGDAPDFDESASLTARLVSVSRGARRASHGTASDVEGPIYAEANREGAAGKNARLGRAYQHPGGAFDVILMPRANEYYQGGMRVTRRIPLWGLDNSRVAEVPTGTYEARRQEALLNIARREVGVYSEMAKMAVGLWSYVDIQVLSEAAAGLGTGRGDTYGDLLGLLSIQHRFRDAPEFPAEAFQPLEVAIAQIDFEGVAGEYGLLESHELLAATAELLAGQRCPELIFVSSGERGTWHRARGERRALDWMHARAQRGLRAWHSDLVLEETFLAISCIIDMADDEQVWEAATVLMDKLLFLLGLNSFKGVFGASRGLSSTTSLFGGYLEATSGVSKLMLGMGVVNDAIRATTRVACMQEYELPVMLQVIAADLPEEGIWNREHHGLEGDDGAELVSYKTPDFLLSSVQDYKPGEPGDREHVWQATLGHGATVFVTHPTCNSLEDARSPNFWLGNDVLPRVVQWHDALVALYRLPEDDWMGFTHAYFPVHAFDEVVFPEGAGWAFARKGDGYLALWASQEMTFIRSGHSAYRELRAYGSRTVWLGQMGRAALDGDFAAFRERVLSLPVSVEGLDVRWTTLRGDMLEIGWQGPCLRNGEPLPLRTASHLESPYCVAEFPASVMDIRRDDVVMRLKLSDD